MKEGQIHNSSEGGVHQLQKSTHV